MPNKAKNQLTQEEVRELPLVLTPDEVAGILRVPRIHVVKMAAKGKIKGFKVGGLWRFQKSSVLSLLVS